MPLIFGNTKLILNAFAALVHEAPGTASLAYHQSFIDANNGSGNGAAIYVAALDGLFAGESTASLATTMRTNLGITAVCTQAVAEAYLTAFASNRVGAILNLANELANYSGSDTAILAAKANYNATIVDSYNYTTSGVSVPGKVLTTGSHDFVLTSALDNLTGTTGDDLFTAGINTLGTDDVLKGGLGLDTLFADVGTVAAITPKTTGIETVQIRAQYATDGIDGTDNNTHITSEVQLDAQRMQGVTQWESNNSRADLLIEDVRILDNQITKDITIAMVETDPGHVDFGVYFDQHSLRNLSSATSSINLQVMDTVAAAAGKAPLLNSTYGAFTFTATTNGVSQVVTLASQAIQDAQTYVELVAAFQAALDAQFGAGAASATLGADFTVVDPASGIACTGKSVLLTANSAITYTTPAGSGWSSQGTAPAQSNFYTNYNTAATTAVDLVTSKVILDDVGRGSTGGDLVIGGLSVGDTSTSKGVGRFEIEVRDNSKLQTINSTNNTLKEVTIKNGVTSSFSDAYTTTVKDAGNLTVNGSVNDLDQDGQNSNGRNVALPGTLNQHNGFGFSDVRLIDASTMTGKLEFTAEFTARTIDKYLNLKDIQALPAGDNVAVTYTGGTNDDTMVVTLDSGAVSSNNHIVAGREDFTFNFNGGAGNDTIDVTMAGPRNALSWGGEQAWYTNEKLNANVFIDGGDGNDTIKTPGAGDIVIKAGAGDDVVYTDNVGAKSTAIASGAAQAAAAAYAAAAAAELAKAQAAFVLENATGFVGSNSVGTATFITPTQVVAALETLDHITPTNPPALPVITHAALAAGTAAAAAAGAITLEQKVALDAAYNSFTGAVVTPAVGVGGPSTLVGGAAVAGNVTAAELAAGDTLLATYIAAAKALEAADTAAVANVAAETALLNATQLAVVNAYMAINGVEDMVTAASEIGTATVVAGLAALRTALVSGATQATAVAAIDVADHSGVLAAVGTTNAAVLAAVGAGAMDATDAANVVALLSPLQNTAALNNAAAQATYAAALAADQAAVNVQAVVAANNPVLGDTVGAPVVNVAADAVGSNEAAAAAAAAAAASAAAAADVAASQAINTALEGLKAAVNVGSLDADVNNAIANAVAAINVAIADSAAKGTGAVAANPLTPAVQAALLVLVGSPGNAVDAAEELAFDTGALGVFNANAVNSLIIANTTQTAALTAIAADLAATATATQKASLAATAAVNSGPASPNNVSAYSEFVFDTANQKAVDAGYVLATNDERNAADLKSDVNDSYNFFNSTVKVSYKGLDASVVVAGTNAKTTDLEINQAIKKAINSDAVLSKLLVAEDGPGNSLVVKSLIDGVQKVTDLSVSVTVPTTATAADLSAAIAAGVVPAAATTADLLTAMGAAKVAFDAKGDYVTQFAETGAGSGNAQMSGANSVGSSDNTITLGTGNDVLVLGTTVQTSLLTSSNEKVVFDVVDFGNDTIVHFAAAGLGIDQLDFTALHGSGKVAFGSLSLDNSIVVAAETAANDTAAEIAALFTDSATAINHIYVAYNAHNVGNVYQVTDAAGTAAGNVTAKLIGTIDLADTGWATLTAANFA